jgi:starch-binding outer membrane protein, SusD/RagB family
MKRIFYILALVLVFSSSCTKDYLETKPTDQYSDVTVFSSTTNAYSALNGMHRMMYEQSGNYYTAYGQDKCGQQSMNIVSDVLGEDVLLPNSTNSYYRGIYQWLDGRNETAAWPRYVFTYYYMMVVNANMIIKNIDAATGPDVDKRLIKGEALAYRGWAHFILVQFFAKRYDAASKPNSQAGIPIMVDNVTTGLKRSTVEEVYTQINKDLSDAITSLTGAAARTSKSHLDLNVVKGIKARVALTMQDWATAAQLAAEARASYSLMTNAEYLAGFNSVSNREWMWGSYVQDDQTNYFYGFFAFMSGNAPSTNIKQTPKVINADLYNLISATDVRKKCWDPTGATIPAPSGGLKAKYGILKFLTTTPLTSSFMGDPVYMRAGEMYLIEAEAKARSGQDAAAQTALYTLAVNRDPAYVKSVKTGQALVDEIALQRRMELWGEGFRFFDLKRQNLPLNRACANYAPSVGMIATVAAGDNAWQWLIPKDEFNANPNLGTQNP